MIYDIKLMFTTYKNQDEVTKRLTMVSYFYSFIVGLGDVFINIMIYDLTKNLSFLILYNLLRATGAISATILNYQLLRLNYNIKNIYLYFVSILSFSFLLLHFSNYNLYLLLVFGTIYGFAIGTFWFGQHNYILNNISHKGRDFFASMISLGKEIFTILVPAIAIISFYISENILNIQTYDTMVFLLAFVSISMLFFTKKVKDFKPEYHTFKEGLSLLDKNKLKPSFYWYNFFRGVFSSTRMTFLTFIGIEALNSAMNIGIVEFITGVLSIFLVSKLSAAKYSSNRMKIMFFAFLIMSFAYLVLILSEISAFGYIIFSLILIIANPMYNTSLNLIDMHTMDIIKIGKSHSFGIMYRELVIFIGKLITPIILILIVNMFHNAVVISGFLGLIILISAYIKYLISNKIYKEIH